MAAHKEDVLADLIDMISVRAVLCWLQSKVE